jgi:hypothetical protein
VHPTRADERESTHLIAPKLHLSHGNGLYICQRVFVRWARRIYGELLEGMSLPGIKLVSWDIVHDGERANVEAVLCAQGCTGVKADMGWTENKGL